MSVPALRFKEFSQTLTPENFGHVISTNKYGPRFDASDYDTNGNVKTIRGTDVSLDGEIKYSQVPRAKLDENLIKDNLLNDGDLIMITTADCGLTGVFRKQEIEYIPSAYAVKIELNELGFPYYFKYYFQTKRVKDEINKYVRKGTVANLPLSDIGKISIKLPNIVEQTKIANFLTAVDEKITQLTQKHDLLTQYKKGVMQQIFSQELRFKDDDGRDFPEWEETTLGDISVKKSSNIAANKIEGNVGKYKIYGASGVLKEVDFFTQNEAYISIVKDGAGVGRVFLCEPKTSVLGTMDIIQPKENICISFLYAVLEQIDFVIYVTGSTIPHIYYKDYSKEEVSVPSLKEQTKIADFLTSIDDKITATQTQLQAVKQYKQGLLQQMFV